MHISRDMDVPKLVKTVLGFVTRLIEYFHNKGMERVIKKIAKKRKEDKEIRDKEIKEVEKTEKKIDKIVNDDNIDVINDEFGWKE